MQSLNSCRSELRSIINELEDIEWGIRHEFVGIGQDLCGDSVEMIKNKYLGVLTRLNNVDSNRLADWVMGN